MMQPISGIRSGAAWPHEAVNAAGEPSKTRQTGEEVKEQERSAKPVREVEKQNRAARPARDEYIPEKRPEKTPGVDGGQQGKNVKDPDKNPDKKVSDSKGKGCTCNTDKVDREIEKLKKKQKELEQQIHSGTDESRIRELEKELAQVERELGQKDNDAYRRQHAVYTYF